MSENRRSLEGFIPSDYFYPDKKKQGLALASLVIGVASCLTFGLLGLGTICGIVLGIVALVKIRKDPAQYGGKGMAVTGIVTSALSGVLFAFIVSVFAYKILVQPPSFRPSNEEAAITRLKGIARSEKTYRQYVSMGNYGTLEDLRGRNFIDHGASKDGYKYAVRLRDDSYEAVATPEKYGAGTRISYYITTDGALHFADRQGGEATAADPVLAGIGPKAK
jgi:hypothetical protein